MSLAGRQAELVAALVAGGPAPAGFEADRLAPTRRALLRKRAGEAARAWPLLAAGFGTGWAATFSEHIGDRPPAGSLRDGWDVARALRAAGALGAAAAGELAERKVTWRYDGTTAARRRRMPAAALGPGSVFVQVRGRVVRFGPGRR